LTATIHAWPRRDAKGRTNQRVRRDSREALPREPAAFLTMRQRRERLDAFRRHARALRQPGRRWGAGWRDGRLMKGELHENPEAYCMAAADVLAYLMHHAVRSGRVFPTFKEISAAVGCAYRTAVRCVQQLKRGGWLAWERRFVRVGQAGARELQVVQTSNLYQLKLPSAAGQLIDAWHARQAPSRDSVEWEIERRGVTGEAEAAEVEAVIFARQEAHRGNKHFLHHLATARTPEAVARVLQGEALLKNALGRLGSALSAKGEFPGGFEAQP
jgi:hypothetical protein